MRMYNDKFPPQNAGKMHLQESNFKNFLGEHLSVGVPAYFITRTLPLQKLMKTVALIVPLSTQVYK